MKRNFFYMFLLMLGITFGVTILGITNVIFIQEKYLYGLYTALLIEMIAAIIGLFKRTEFFNDPLPAGQSGMGIDLSAYPTLGHIFKRMEERKDGDFLLHTFFCPDTTPVTQTILDYTSLSYLWADPRGSSIAAAIEPNQGVMALHIRFLNEKNTFPANIAIRPAGKHPLKRVLEHNYLCFDGMVPAPLDGELADISMSFRFIDKMGTHWSRMKGEDLYENILVSHTPDEPWKSFAIPLTDDKWRVFNMDGNHRYGKPLPDIGDLILGVVIEFGGDRRDERPGPGKGCVWLRNFRLSDRIV